jgi:hypothetical protein
MNDVNRGSVIVNLSDVSGKTITDQVEMTFYNQRSQSLSQRFKVRFRGAPVTLPNVPAFPFGLAEVFIKPKKYRFKTIFVDVPAGEPGRITEKFLVDPKRVSPVFPTFNELQNQAKWSLLTKVLRESEISSETAWDKLTSQQKAGLLNIFSKMQDEIVDGEKVGFAFLERVTRFLPARIYALVERDLHEIINRNQDRFRRVSGSLHEFGEGWNMIEDPNSFKSTKGRAGTLQLTFARDSGGRMMADIDIDDHAGIKHAADVLKHKITDTDTHPYDIHNILVLFQGVDPGYGFA